MISLSLQSFKKFSLFTLLITVLVASGCTWLFVKPEKERIRKVIVSHVGELERDTRFVRDKVKFRVYYKNSSKKSADIGIVDRLDSGLEDIRVFNTGWYHRANHAVIWLVRNVSAGGSGFVQFEATLGREKTILNQAQILIGAAGLRNRKIREKYDLKTAIESLKLPRENVIDTNKVEVIVRGKPKLGWIPFDPNFKKEGQPRSNMKDETTMDIMINFDVPGMYVSETMVDGVTYHHLSMPMHANRMEVGKPQVPVVGRIIEVPKGVDFEVEIVKKKSIKLYFYNVIPAQEPEIRRPFERVKKKFRIDRATYLNPVPHPEKLSIVRPQDIGIIRGHRLVFLKTYPVQFNPLTKEITAYSRIEVKLKYSKPAQIQPVDPRIYSPAFEDLLEKSVINFKDYSRFARGEARQHKEVGCDYLILTHGDFYNATDNNNPIVRFAEWKRQKGYTTKVVDIADIPAGQTAEDIRDYLMNAYEKWYPVPTYVLLVGDSEFLPTNYQEIDGTNTSHPYPHYNGADTGTDLYYSTVDGSDHYPDIFIGRISVDTTAEAEDVIDKILDYEQNPPTNANYYTDNSLVQLFEDVLPRVPDPANPGTTIMQSEGREDGTFRIIEFAEEIRTFLQNNGYNSQRIYDQSGNFANGPQRYEDGTNLPANLTIAGGFPWNGGTANISNEINAGNFLVIYDGHGARRSWGRPGFNNANVNALANANLTPVVLSLACETGWFDNETDDDVTLAIDNRDTANNDESLCETFLRHNNGGAVGIIGASRVSYEENDFMMLGMVTAIWPEFDPNPPLRGGQMPDFQTSILRRLGQINTLSKIFMANAYEDDQLQFELYHVFGDPEMPIWTEEPVALEVKFPEGVGSTGEQDFVVRVLDSSTNDPVNMAQVTLTKDGSIIATRQTNPGGIARFTLSGLSAGDMEITVVRLNYRPFQDKIIVSPSGAQLNRLDPSDGMENQVIHVGGMDFSGNENVDIYFADANLLSTAASGGSFGQAGISDVDIQVPSPHDLGPVNVLTKGATSNRYAVDVFQVRSANPIDLYTYSQWDSSTWHLYTGNNPTWNNPEIQIYEATTNNPVESNNLTVGHNYIIRLKVHNDTGFSANNVKVTFKWANFGVGQPDRVWGEIDTVEVDVPRNSVREAEVRWTPGSTGHLCIRTEVYHLEDINNSNNSGQENCHVGPTSSPAIVPFIVWNPTEKPAMVYFELRQQLMTENVEMGEVLWGSIIVHPDPQLIPPGEKRKAEVVLDPDVAVTKIRPGQEAEFSITGFIDGKVIGGANFIIRKEK